MATWSWGCSKCKGNPEGDSKRRLRNCDDESNANVSWAWMPGLRRCPWSIIDDETWAMLTWWQDWKTLQVLPWGGSDLMEQPAYVLQAFRQCETTLNELNKEEQTKQQKAYEKQQRELKRNMSNRQGGRR